MSIAMAVRLVLGLICGGTLTWAVWDRSERELADRTKEEPHEGPRFLPGISSYYLPMLMLLYPILGVIVGGAQMAVQITLGLLIRVFLEMSVYYVLLMAVMPWLRSRSVSREHSLQCVRSIQEELPVTISHRVFRVSRSFSRRESRKVLRSSRNLPDAQ